MHFPPEAFSSFLSPRTAIIVLRTARGFCGELGWVGFLVVCFLHKINPNQRKTTKKYLLWEKGPKIPILTENFLGLGWPWLGELVGFIIVFICFPAQQKLVNRKHPCTSGPIGIPGWRSIPGIMKYFSPQHGRARFLSLPLVRNPHPMPTRTQSNHCLGVRALPSLGVMVGTTE